MPDRYLQSLPCPLPEDIAALKGAGEFDLAMQLIQQRLTEDIPAMLRSRLETELCFLPRLAACYTLTQEQLVLAMRRRVASFREQELDGIFKSNPGRIIDMMQQLSRRLRKLTKDYQAACETAANVVKAEEKAEDAMTREEIGARVAHYANEIERTRAAML